MYISLSNPTITGLYTNQVKTAGEYLTAYEMGGVALQNPSQGLLVQLWTATSDGTNVWVTAPNQSGEQILILQDANITDLDLAFDQNMFPFITYVSNGLVKFYWFDPVNVEFVLVTLLELAASPRCTLDDKRPLSVSSSDVLLVYINLFTQQLCYRAQRDRYNIEYVLNTLPENYRVRCINFATSNRVQLTVDDFTPQVSQTAHNGLVNMTRPISLTGAYIT